MYLKGRNDTPPEWLSVKEEIWQRFRGEPWFTGVGIGEWGVRVYVFGPGDVEKVPQMIRGILITVHISGEITALCGHVPAEKEAVA